MCDDVKNTIVDEQDDGSLACLHISCDEETDFFRCAETTQSRLVNTTFWVVAFKENIQTRFTRKGEEESDKRGKMLIKIKPEKDSPESEAQKFFTGSREIQNILRKVKEMGKLPRRVTLRGGGNVYYLE